jgi:hypothetical protein
MQLLRLISYIDSTASTQMFGYIGDDFSKLTLRLYCDADFAGDAASSRSTSGAWLGFSGPSSWWPILWVSRRQTCASHSTPEAEVISVAAGLRCALLPIMSLIAEWMRVELPVILHEDNSTCTRILEVGISAALAHVDRTHRVSLAWLHDVLTKLKIPVEQTNTNVMVADAFTKSFAPAGWKRILDLLTMWTPPQSL